MTRHYSLNDFNEILFGEPSIQYKLDTDTENIITYLANLLGVVNYITPTSSFQQTNQYSASKPLQGHSHHLSKRSKPSSSSANSSFTRKDKEIEDSWLQPAFKTTKIEKKEGSINEIRTCLNKLSQKNYETNKIQLLELIRNSDQAHLPTIANTIFDTASTNKFYSEIYAQLYKELLAEFHIFTDILQTFIQTFTETMRDIVYVDANTNYDDFCAYNKKNDARKATSVFITNLSKKGVLPIQTLATIIFQIQAIMHEYIQHNNTDIKKTNEVEEITENIYLLITATHTELKSHVPEQWNILLANIQRISQCKAKENPSLTSRAIFKHLDMLDVFHGKNKC